MEKKSSQEALTTIENLIDRYHPTFKQQLNPEVNKFFEQLTSVINSKNVLVLKSIKELPLHFLVDDYQRGYKWQVQQVKELLNDIYEFEVENDNFYCLQPVVVKYHPANLKTEKSYWELIDGQQRMTTIYLILNYLGKAHYSIDYKTRKSSRDFLANKLSDTLKFDDWNSYIKSGENSIFDNVDNYHFYIAYKTIENWFSNEKYFPNEQIKEEWLNKLLNHTKVIWYAAQEGLASVKKRQSIDIFMRINSGKIPLTNAELIKALFLHHVAEHDNKELALLQQSEMAQQWDIIEHGLQNDEFWGFLHNNSDAHEKETRIELLFDLISVKPKANNNETLASQDDFYAFNHFNTLVRGIEEEGERLIVKKEDKRATVRACWNEVRQGYYRLLEWFNNDELYHLTGFLISRKISSIQDLWDLAKNQSKSVFQEKLKNIIATKINAYFGKDDKETLSFSQLQYDHSDRKHIISVLMLMNIDIHRRNKTRFSFKAFNDNKWDIEHIHAQNSKPLDDQKQADTWFTEQINLLSSEDIPDSDKKTLNLKLHKWNELRVKNIEDSKDSYNDYLVKLAEIVGEFKEDEMNSLDNLCLLSNSVNRGISNEIFSKKRQMIIQYEKEMNEQETTQFIPIATKQIFSKYYSDTVSQMHKWSKGDRDAYRAAMIRSLSYYGLKDGLK